MYGSFVSDAPRRTYTNGGAIKRRVPVSGCALCITLENCETIPIDPWAGRDWNEIWDFNISPFPSLGF